MSDDSDENSAASTARRRKVSKFRADKSMERKLIEGTFKLSESMNYEEYLAGIGTGPFTQDLVMRAGMVLRINQVSLSNPSILLFCTVILIVRSWISSGEYPQKH